MPNYENEAMPRYNNEGYGQNTNGEFGDSRNLGETGDSGNSGDLEDVNSLRQYSIAGDLGRMFVNSKVGTPVRKIGGAAGSLRKWTGGKAKAVGNKVGNAKRAIQNNDKFRYLADSKEGQLLKGAGRVVRYTAKQGIRQARRTVGGAIAAAPNVATKTLAGAALGATAGAVGVGATMVSGDPSNLFTYAGGAAAAAAAIGISGSGVQTSSTKTATQIARERQFYGDKYDEHVAQKNMKDWKRNTQKREELEKHLGAANAKELYKGDNPAIDQYLKNDITDAKDIATIEKMLKDKNIKSREEGIAIQMNVDKKGDLTKMKPKDKEDWRKEDAKIYRSKGYSEEQANQMAKNQQEKEINFLKTRKRL